MNVAHSVGPILLGGVFNTFLLGAIVVQCHFYFINFPRDRTWLKLLVSYLLVMNLLNTGFDIALVWHYTITKFGDFPATQRSMWLYTIEPVMTVMISTVTQAFYAWRITRLTGWVWVGYSIAGSAIIQMCAGIGGSIGISIVTNFSMFHKFKTTLIIWLGLSAITDIVISAVLAWYLHKHRTGFPTTDHVISRLIRLTIQTGIVTTACAVADLVTYLCLTDNMHLFFQLVLCKTYTNTLMATLNARVEPSTSRPPTVEARETVAIGRSMRQRLCLNVPPNQALAAPQHSPLEPKILHLDCSANPQSSTTDSRLHSKPSRPSSGSSLGTA